MDLQVPEHDKTASVCTDAARLSTKPLFSKGDRGFVMPKSGYREEGKNPSGHNQPFNVLSSGGQEALFPHVLNSKHTGKT